MIDTAENCLIMAIFYNINAEEEEKNGQMPRAFFSKTVACDIMIWDIDY